MLCCGLMQGYDEQMAKRTLIDYTWYKKQGGEMKVTKVLQNISIKYRLIYSSYYR